MPPISPVPADVVTWLADHFIASFERDVDPTIWTPIDGHHRGFFGITMLTLGYCDAMSGLVAGKANGGTELAVRFLENEVGKASAVSALRYSQRSAALYTLYRHRLSHQREPGVLEIDARHHLIWRITRAPSRDEHLWLKVRNAGFTPLQLELSVSADLLRADVYSAFLDVKNRAAADAGLAKSIYEGAFEAASAKEYEGKNKYIRQQLSTMVLSPDA